jgi:uncharacterized protein (TIGR02118 family)
MLRKLMGPALKKVDIEKGIAGGAPGTTATYQTVGNLHFDSVEAFQAAFGPHAGEIMGDIANYTDAQPIERGRDRYTGLHARTLAKRDDLRDSGDLT